MMKVFLIFGLSVGALVFLNKQYPNNESLKIGLLKSLMSLLSLIFGIWMVVSFIMWIPVGEEDSASVEEPAVEQTEEVVEQEEQEPVEEVIEEEPVEEEPVEEVVEQEPIEEPSVNLEQVIEETNAVTDMVAGEGILFLEDDVRDNGTVVVQNFDVMVAVLVEDDALFDDYEYIQIAKANYVMNSEGVIEGASFTIEEGFEVFTETEKAVEAFTIMVAGNNSSLVASQYGQSIVFE